LHNHISVYLEEKIANCLSKTDCILPEDLDKNADIYIKISAKPLRQWKNLLTLMVSQFLSHFEERPDKTGTPILFLLDEFPRLGKIEIITDALATLRSKNITICLLLQSLAQLDYIYGKTARQVIVDNCQYKAILNATDAESQKYFSDLVGKYEYVKPSKNQNFEPITKFKAGVNINHATDEKLIIRPEEFATLTDIVLLTPFGFTRVNKSPYYNEKQV